MSVMADLGAEHKDPETNEDIVKEILGWSLSVPFASVVMGLEYGFNSIIKSEQAKHVQKDRMKEAWLRKALEENDGNTDANSTGVQTGFVHPLTKTCFQIRIASKPAKGNYQLECVEESHGEEWFARIWSGISEALIKFRSSVESVEKPQKIETLEDSEEDSIQTEVFMIPVLLPHTLWQVSGINEADEHRWSDDTIKARYKLMYRTAHEAYDAYIRLLGLDDDPKAFIEASPGAILFSTKQKESDVFAEELVRAHYTLESSLYDIIKASGNTYFEDIVDEMKRE